MSETLLLLPQVAQSAQERREETIAQAKAQWQQVRQAFCDVVNVSIEAVQQWFSRLAEALVRGFSVVLEQLKSLWTPIAPLVHPPRYSRQTRAFLAVKRRRTVSIPHAHTRRTGSRRKAKRWA